MIYKRNEFYRYTFEEPCDATFRLIIDTNETSQVELSNRGNCRIIDISPNGLRMSSEFKISIDQLKHIEMQFILDELTIRMVGNFVWSHKKPYGYEYGVRLLGDEESEKIITSELKNRRKKEMNIKKEA